MVYLFNLYTVCTLESSLITTLIVKLKMLIFTAVILLLGIYSREILVFV